MKQAAVQAGRPAMVKVWDPLVRVFHWTLVLSFFGAWLATDWRSLHKALGYVAVSAVGIRVVWGLIGPGHARFASFVPGPARFLSYAAESWRGTEKRFLGHNPAGGAMVVALLTMVIAIAVTGWMMGLHAYRGADWLEELHESAVNATLLLVALHVAGVFWESWRHGENLIAAMFTGRKRL
jgi:cytochrome b